MIRKDKRFLWISSGIVNLLVIIPIVFFLVSTSKGLKTTSDSDYYLEMARNFHEYNELSLDDGTQLIYWPPLYPLTLSLIIQKSGSTIRVFNLFLFLVTLFAWYYLADREIKSNWFFKVLISTSTSILMVFVFVWSESLFLFLLSGYVVLLYRFFKSGSQIMLYMAALAGFMALLTRHAGVFIIPGFFVGLFIGWTRKTTYEKRDAIAHMLIVISGFLFWNIFTIFFKHQEFVIAELFSTYNGTQNVTQTLRELGTGFSPYQLAPTVTIVTGFMVLVMAVYFGIRTKDRFYMSLTFSLCIYVITWFVLSADIYDISRFLAIILPVVFFLLSKGFDAYPEIGKRKIIFALFMIWLIYPLMRIFINSLLWGGQIQFYNEIKNMFPGISI